LLTCSVVGKGGKNVKRGKNGNAEETRRALQYKEDGQGIPTLSSFIKQK
jgi:hypothetical protein